MKKALAILLAVMMIFAALPTVAAFAEETTELSYTDHQTGKTEYDVTTATIAWVKQAKGALIWVVAGDSRSDDEIIAQAKAADPSLANAVSEFAVMRGFDTAETPNSNGSKATVTVSAFDGLSTLSIEGDYSHFVAGINPTIQAPTEAVEVEPEIVAEPETEAPQGFEGETVTIRIDTALKMAVEFADGTVYYGGEMKEVVYGQEYLFRMCAVNWDNGLLDDNNGLRGTVVFRMIVLHRNDFLAIARAAAQDPDRYTVKGMDVIDNVDKKIYVNGDAEDAHLETDVNNFFMAYRFHFSGSEYDKKTGIENVINTPVEGLSVNLPVGTTVTCKAYHGEELLGSDDIFITGNGGEGIYEDEYLTSVNDYTWAY